MKTVLLVTLPRILLGLIFLVSAVDGFWWMTTGNRLIHPPTSEQGLALEAVLQQSFIWPIVKVVNLTGALSLLANVAPAFGLALIAPIMTVIVFFHLVLNPQGLPVAIILVVLGLMLAFAYRQRYAALFR
ncbi:hypothetical protein [Bosea thiooxidans]